MWALKALHPSDPAVDVRGLPDQFSGSTTALNFQQVVSVKPDPAATGTWSCDVLFNPDGVSFGYVRVQDSIGVRYTELLNTQLGIPDLTNNEAYNAGLSAWRTSFEKWRLIYAGVTAYQDGPALSNQGTVAACQYTMRPTRFVPIPQNVNGLNNTAAATNFGCSHTCVQYQASDLPSYEKSQSQPNAYFGESKAGVYMPLRLGPNHQQWHDASEITGWVASVSEYTGSAFYPQVPFSGGDDTISFPNIVIPALTATGANIFWPEMSTATAPANSSLRGFPPHPQLTSACFVLDGVTTTAKIQKFFGRANLLPQCSENVGSLTFRNIATSAGLQFYLRVGMEVQCPLGSPYTPYLRVAPAYDPKAVEMYYKISRELKDAYPAEFNDLGKLWEVIKGAARAVSGALSFVPGPVGMIASGVRGFLGPDPAPKRTSVLEPNVMPQDKPPAAALERVQDALRAAPIRKRVTPATRALAKIKRTVTIRRR